MPAGGQLERQKLWMLAGGLLLALDGGIVRARRTMRP
jgi:hypothetical protein